MGTEGKEYNYRSECMYTNIPGAGRQYTGGDQVWDQSAIKNYFYQCMYKLKPFNEHSSALVTAMAEFINDEAHTGEEAEASKKFLNENLALDVMDLVRAVQILEGMMIEPGFEGSVPIVRAFKESLNEDDTAIITKSKLDKIIIDFARYINDFDEQAQIIYDGRKEAEETLKLCEEFIQVPVLTYLHKEVVHNHMASFVSNNGKTGKIPLFRDNFLSFLSEHNDDFSKSDFRNIVDRICANLKRVEVGLGDGAFDPQKYNDQLQNIVYDKGEYNQAYEDYITTYQCYILGYGPKSLVYAYDPVNMSSGNFVCENTDLVVGTRHPISVKRSYNALSDQVGMLGKGWVLNFEQYLSKRNDTFTLIYGDGKEGTFAKNSINGEEVYLEIHGGEGILRVTDNGYRITNDDNSYVDYDKDGYAIAYGDNYGQHTSIEYDLFEKRNEDKVEKKALPVKVVTKEGNTVYFSYDNDGLLVKTADHSGRIVTYHYEDEKDKYRLTSVTDPNGNTQKFRYSDNGLIKDVVRADGIVGASNEYDSRNRVTKQILANGGEFNFKYDDENHTITTTEANGCKVEYLSDEVGHHIGTRYVDLGIEDRYSYNSKGQRISHTDKRGFTTKYSYDNRGHVTGVVGPEGLHEFFTYDSDGKLSSKKDSEGNVTKFKYGIDGSLYCVTNALGGKIRYYYDDEGRIISVRDANDQRTHISYDERGNVSEVTDIAGVTTKYENDLLGRVIASEDPCGNRTIYEYDANNNLTKVVDPEGNETRYEYNSLGKVSAIINPDGTKKTWEFNEIGKPSAFTDEDNRTTRVYYNISTQEERIVFPNNGTMQYEYDIVGRRTGVIDALGRKSVYEYDKAGNKLASYRMSEDETEKLLVSSSTYDGLGRITSETDGEGNVTRYSYDKNGNLIEKIDANDGKTSYKYDALSRLIETVDPIGRVTRLSYTPTGKLQSTTDYLGVVTENIFEDGRIKKVVKKAGNETHLVHEYEYDSCGRVRKVTESDGLCKEYTYDKAGRIIRLLGSDGRDIAYSYDACGRMTELSNSGAITKYSYTGTGKLKSVTDSLGGVIEYTYDELDNLSKVERFGYSSETDEKDRITVFEHNLAGELISITDALGQKDLYTYDVFGKLKTHVDRDGNTIAYTRDTNGNVIGIDYSDGKNVKLKYNALGVLEEIKDHLGITKIDRDAVGRMISVTDFEGRTVDYEYVANNAKAQIVYPNGNTAKYAYDSYGKLISLSNLNKAGESEEVISYEYDDYGRLALKTLPNGISTSYDYYQGGLLKTLTTADEQGVLDKYEYHYDSRLVMDNVKRNRRGLNEISGVYDYEHDALGRLVKTSFNGIVKTTYDYDAFGNRIRINEGDKSTVYHYDSLDRLTDSIISVSGVEESINRYGYDRRGNQTALYVNDVLQKTFTFDATNMLVHADDKEAGEVSYSYNGLGYRVKSERPDEVIKYLCDLSMEYHNLLEQEVNGNKQTFVYDSHVAIMQNESDNFYYLNDELGSGMYLTGTDGNVVGSYSYDDFGRKVDPFTGKILDNTRSYVKDGNILQPFAFTGYQDDEVTGLNFAQARFYNNETGRFVGEDQVKGYINKPQSINHYLYCLNNPQNFVDRNGKEPDDFRTDDPVAKTLTVASEASEVKTNGLVGTIVVHTIADNYDVSHSGSNASQGCLSETVDVSSNDKGEYVGAIYLLAKDGAAYQGHAAVVLVKDNGEADCFSIGGDINWGDMQIDGYFGTNCTNGQPAPMDYYEFVQSGNLPHDNINSPNVNGDGQDLYSHFIYFPITNQEGIDMYNRAIERRNIHIDEQLAYNLLDNNCGQNAQYVLGPYAFAPDGVDFNLFMSKPNVQYLTGVDMINNGQRVGYYGSIDDLRMAYCN